MLRIFLFLLLSATAGTTYATANILVFGDSISAGYGLARDQGWVELLRARLTLEHFDYKVINASVSGETTTGGKARLGAALSQFQPHIVIIELGGNDGLRGGRIDAMRDNLAAMIAECRRRNSRVLLVGMQVPPNYGNDYREKFRLVYDTLAKTQHVPQVSFLFEGFGDDRSLFQPDGIHPTAAAQEKILNNVWPRLRPLLAAQTAKRRMPGGAP